MRKNAKNDFWNYLPNKKSAVYNADTVGTPSHSRALRLRVAADFFDSTSKMLLAYLCVLFVYFIRFHFIFDSNTRPVTPLPRHEKYSRHFAFWGLFSGLGMRRRALFFFNFRLLTYYFEHLSYFKVIGTIISILWSFLETEMSMAWPSTSI